MFSGKVYICVTKNIRMTLKEMLSQSCARYSGRPALSFVHGKPLSYRELGELTRRIGDMLRSLGLRPGTRVGILSGNMPHWPAAYYAVISEGAVVVPILPDFHPDEVHNILEHSGSEILFVSDKYREQTSPGNLPALRHMIRLEDLSLVYSRPADQPAVPAPVDERAYFARSPEPLEEDLAAIIYTSGTTGRSKGVMLTHKNIVFDVMQCQTIHQVYPEDVFLSILPLSHTYENTLGLHLAIACGASVYYLEKPPTAAALLPALKKIRPTLMLSVPLVIEKIYRNQVLAKFTANRFMEAAYRFPPVRKLLHKLAGNKLYDTFGGRLKFFGIGGARLDPQAERFLKEGGFPYAIGYGLTETAPLIAGADAFKTRLQSTGPPMQGVQMKIEDPNPATGVGEILVKGENVMPGYYRDMALTRTVFTDDGWFRTGDLGCFDRDGYLYIKGRSKTMIVGASGENIYPEDIEALLNNIRGINESLVVQQKGKLVAMVHMNWEEFEANLRQMGQEARSYIQEKTGDAMALYHEKTDEWLEEIKQKVNQRLNKFSQIHKIKPVAEPFEKTPTQKIKRYLYGHKH